MGINANRQSIVHPFWSKYVRRISRGFETALIQVVIPGSQGDYDPESATFSGGTPDQIAWPAISGSTVYGSGIYGEGVYSGTSPRGLYGSGVYGSGIYGGDAQPAALAAPAWFEFVNAPRQLNVDPYPSNVRVARVHIDISKYGSTSDIRSGMQVRVISGGEDDMLEDLVAVVESATNGNITGQRTLTCTVDQKVRLP